MRRRHFSAPYSVRPRMRILQRKFQVRPTLCQGFRSLLDDWPIKGELGQDDGMDLAHLPFGSADQVQQEPAEVGASNAFEPSLLNIEET